MPVLYEVRIPSQSADQEPVTDTCAPICVCVRARERERESVCVWGGLQGLVGSCNLCVVFLLLWERNVSIHVRALMDSCSVNLL
jgi:hypothetical protein